MATFLWHLAHPSLHHSYYAPDCPHSPSPLSLLDFFTLLLRITPWLFYLYRSILSFWTFSSSLLYSLPWSFQQMLGLERHKPRILLRKQDREKDCRHLVLDIFACHTAIPSNHGVAGSKENCCLSWPNRTWSSNPTIKYVITKDRLQLIEPCVGNIFVNMQVIIVAVSE